MSLGDNIVMKDVWLQHVRALENHEPFQNFTFKRFGHDGARWMSSFRNYDPATLEFDVSTKDWLADTSPNRKSA